MVTSRCSETEHKVRRIFHRFVAFALMILAAGCEKSEPAKPAVPEAKKHEYLPNDEYFPLVEGSFWDYHIEIVEGKDYYTLNEHLGDPPLFTTERHGKGEKGPFRLRYRITQAMKDGFTLDIEKDDLGLFADCKSASFRITDDPGLFGRTAILHMFTRRTTTARQPPMVKLQMDNRSPRTPGTARLLSLCTRYPEDGIGFKKEDNEDYFFLMMPCEEDKDYVIEVPAGRFDCKMQPTQITSPLIPGMRRSLQELRSVGSLREVLKDPGVDVIMSGWKTYRFFAPGVGLVCQAQFDLAGNRLNEMKLVAYEIPQRRSQRAAQQWPATSPVHAKVEPKIVKQVMTPGDTPLVVQLDKGTEALLKLITEVAHFNEVKLICKSHTGQVIEDKHSLFKDTERILFLPEDIEGLDSIAELRVECVSGHLQIELQYPPVKGEYDQLRAEREELRRRLRKGQ